LIAFAFATAITAPPPPERPDKPPTERRLNAEQNKVMTEYCKRYRGEHFDRCMRDKAQLFGS
jgi:hypothetical protein